jgi:flagellar hook-length control protein FliK
MAPAPNGAQRPTAQHEPQPAGAGWVLPALPLSDEAPVTTVPVLTTADDPPAPPNVALPLPAAGLAGTAPATRPAPPIPQSAEAAERRQPGQAGSASVAEQSAPVPIPGAASIASLLEANTSPPAPRPSARQRIAAVEYASVAARKPVGSVPLHAAAASPDEPRPSAANGPSAVRDVAGVAPAAAPASSPVPVAAELSVPSLPGSTQSSTVAPATPTTPDAPRPTVASPAEQVAPVLVSMAHAPDGGQRLTLRLDPPELGHVQIRIDRPSDAPARVDITVERAETLTLLLRDQPQLQRALDQAGVPPDGRSVTFHVATPEAGPRYDGGPPAGGTGTGSGSASTGDASYGASHQGGRPARGGFADTDDMNTDFARAAPPGWVRAGLDITA